MFQVKEKRKPLRAQSANKTYTYRYSIAVKQQKPRRDNPGRLLHYRNALLKNNDKKRAAMCTIL